MVDMFKEATMLCYLALAGCAADVGISELLKSRKKIATSKYGRRKDLKKLLGDDGIQISKNYQLNFNKTLEHILVLGPTRTNKTTQLFFPNLLSNHLPQCSLVISDPKGELYEKTAAYQKSIGREPILFCPLEPNYSFKYNPLDQCINDMEVKELAQNLLINGDLAIRIQTGAANSSSEWISMAQPLLSTALLYCKYKGEPLNTIQSALELIINHTDKELDLLFSNSIPSVKTQYNLYKMVLGANKTTASIKITLSSNLQLFTDNFLNRSISKTEFTAKDLRNKPKALYITYPEHKSSYLGPFLAVFYTQLINHLIDLEGLPILFMFDEFGNIGHIANFQTHASTASGRNIGFLVCLQSLTQLKQIYGPYNSINILNNLKTKLVLPSLSDIEALRYISDLCGPTQVNITNPKNTYQTKKNLLEHDEVRRIADNKVLIIAHNKFPVLDDQNTYYKQKKYTDNVKEVEAEFR